MQPVYVSIQQQKTGERIRALLTKQGLSVRDVQTAMGFENPQAVYKWLSGKSLPSLDNLVILSRILHTHMEDILVLDGDVSFVARKVYARKGKTKRSRSGHLVSPECLVRRKWSTSEAA